MTAEQHLRDHPAQPLDADLVLANRDRIDRVEQQDLRQVWWHLRRQGVRLPGERNIIAIPGGRP